MCLERLLHNKLCKSKHNKYKKRKLFLCGFHIKRSPEVLFFGTKEIPAIVLSPPTTADTSCFI
ncbi:uncharacterized protein T551_00307 [Pneumocystis jirovecii RU7]|uniref:Uncharacterized protein n=1 Tax=Pneumocystis jirovecii (strain RU7) TaxID=1408657 RepID=A0A0W4ZWS0_PNEJ7|nr:uncharacterized protein T551_00307 [Pneumocystis jirovecii RU7]KTW32822.1 hypothetical protein T551_00307 [Pneumocystis jirovecii RU7]